MRITNRMITTSFTNSLNDISKELNRLNMQVVSGRKFAKSSENTSAAIKAFQIRKDMAKSESYRANIDHAMFSLKDAESALMHIEDLMETASEKIIFGLNGSNSIDERRIIATELRNIQDQLFQTLNSNTTDSYFFGGTNTTNRPFEVVDGKLQYNGYNLDLPLPDEGADANDAMFKSLEKDSLFVDIGLGVGFNALTGEIDESTVFGYSIAGINIVGKGTATVDGEEVSNNLYNLLGAIADEFESEDYSYDRTNALFGHFKDSTSGISSSITEIGAKTSYLEFMIDRVEDRTFNLQEKQLDVEGIDPAAAIINFESQKFAYNAALQMGSQILQPSIFDFMR
ncbi:MAG TPA: flagellin [Anaerovoracaceae bacterium]|nr:flagellin [Anaerovoracaceae bacterium]